MTRCVVCGCEQVVPVRHVAWGGVIAPRLYRLVRCEQCGTRFSGTTGRRERELVPGYIRGVLAVLVLVMAAGTAVWWAAV